VDIQPILQQIRQGNRQAYAPIVAHFQRPLFGYLGRMGLTQAQAEDLAQETFLRAWQALAQYDPQQAAFSTWLFTIAHRLALNELARAAHKHEVVLHDDEAMALDTTPSVTALPLAQLEELEQQQRLQHALTRLPLAERSALALTYSKGLDLKTVAQLEGCSEGTLKMRLHRAREQLRQWLGA
jgi:RNA polymerase sigma-70 factor (ECF subfamily)